MDLDNYLTDKEAGRFLAVSRATFFRQYYPRLIMAVLGKRSITSTAIGHSLIYI